MTHPNNPWPEMPNRILQSMLNPTPEQKLKDVLVRWDAAKQAIQAAKDAEMELRKEAFALGFGADAEEGTNTVSLNNGYELKGVKKLNYTLKAPHGYKGDTVDAVDDCADRFAEISNEGKFVAERLFKWKVDMSLTEYRQLVTDAEQSPIKAKMLLELNKVLVITEAAPTLEVREEKKGRGK